MQSRRRRNPYPHTWEIPLAVTVALALLLVIGLHVGRGVANLMAGNRWLFVDRAELLTSLPAILAGRADAGLAGLPSPASPQLLWWSLFVVEALVLVISGLVLWAGWGRWGSSRIEGTATRAEADALMGIGRLRRHAPLIRPDLYASRGLLRRGSGSVACGGGIVRRIRPAEVGWRLGTSKHPRGGDLWVPWDRTAGVVGPQGSGKTLDLLVPARTWSR